MFEASDDVAIFAGDGQGFAEDSEIIDGLTAQERRQGRAFHHSRHRDIDNNIVFKSLQQEEEYEEELLKRGGAGDTRRREVGEEESRRGEPSSWQGSVYDAESDVGYISSFTIAQSCGLELPLKLTHRALPVKFNGDSGTCEISNETTDRVKTSNENLMGMPGGITITADITNKYFGLHGRSQFFDRLHNVWAQRDFSQQSNATPLAYVYRLEGLDSEKDMTATDMGMIPFSPVRGRFSRYSDRPTVTSSGSYTVTKLSLATAPPVPVTDQDDDGDNVPAEPPKERRRTKKKKGRHSSRSNSLGLRSSGDGDEEEDEAEPTFFYHNNKKTQRRIKVVTEGDVRRHFMAMENQVLANAYKRSVQSASDPTKPVTSYHIGIDTAANTMSPPTRCGLPPLSSPINAAATAAPTLRPSLASDGFTAHRGRGLHVGLGYDCESDGSGDDDKTIDTLHYLTHLLATQALGRDDADDANDGDGSTVGHTDIGAFAAHPSSPRTRYIDACSRQGVAPRVSLLVRRTLSKKLDLRHQGMQDAMCVMLAQSLPGLPYIESINVADNNLTDIGLAPLFDSVAEMEGILELDVSQNEIGPLAAAALSRYLTLWSCSLQMLVLSKADVDDFECERFVSVIKSNKSLTHLDLSYNKIGASENLNTVMPDMITGSEALADLLRSPDCHLRTLILTYNMIRLDGGEELCSSLNVNKSLTYLDLSYNSMAEPGGCALGSALEGNATLEHLIISYNNIGSCACTVICAGIIENRGLRRLVLDGNPIGVEGAKALMIPPTIVGQRLKISAQKCNITMRDSSSWFETDKPLRDYSLHLDDPYERAVFLLLLSGISAHATFVFKDMCYQPEGAKARPSPLTLVQGISRDRVLSFDHKQTRVRNNLQRIQDAAGDVVKAVSLFQQVDEDGSGELETEEFAVLLKSIGFDFDQDRVDEVMAEYDTDGGGTIGMPEFLNFLKKQVTDISARIQDLEEVPIYRLHGSQSKYIPPRAGTVTFTVTDGFARKKIYRVLSPCDREYINEVALQTTDAVSMTGNAVKGYKMRLDEAVALGDTLMAAGKAGSGGGEAEVLTQLLPQAHSASDARALVKKLIGGSKIELLKLKRSIGGAIRPLLGNPDGYYELDMAVEMDRFCIIRLLEISSTFEKTRKAASLIGPEVMGDVSQRGTWSCFRNQIYNGEHIDLGPPFASPLPKSGLLSFDFLSFHRPAHDDLVTSDSKVCNMLVALCLLLPQERVVALSRMHKMRAYHEDVCKRKRYFDRHHELFYEVDDRRAREIGIAQSEFYDNIMSRRDSCKLYKEKEEIKVDFLQDDAGEALWDMPSVYDINDVAYNQKHHRSSKMPKTATLKRRDKIEGDEDSCTDDNLSSVAERSSVLGFEDTDERSLHSSQRSRQGSVDSTIVDAAMTSSTTAAAVSSNTATLGAINSLLGLASQNPRAATIAVENIDFNQPESVINSLIRGGNTPVDPRSPVGSPIVSSIGAHTGRKALEVINRPKPKPMGRRQSLAAGAISEYLTKYRRMICSSKVGVEAKGARVAEAIIEMFGQFQLMCRHLQLLLDLFYSYGHKRNSKYFGTYRVEVICSLFRYVIDLHNIGCVLQVLTPFEVGCLYCRLGWLAIFNPLQCDGAHELDLTRREERIVAKILCTLATNEPGDNLPSEFLKFRWQRDMDPMPGWELTEPWLTEEGMPSRGLLNVTYFTAPKAAIQKLRMGLLKLCFTREEECVAEDDREESMAAGKTDMGSAFVMDRTDMFLHYLAAKPKKKSYE